MKKVKTSQEKILYSFNIDELGFSAEPKMIVNSENINNGTAGLSYIEESKRYISEPEPESSWFCVLTDGDISILFGFLPPIYRNTFLKIKNRNLICGVYVQEIPFDPGSYPEEKLVYYKTKTAVEAFSIFSKELATFYNFKQEISNYIGWNSWEYYLTSVKKEDIVEAMETANLKEEFKGVRAVVIDDGWQRRSGDWEANEKFDNSTYDTAQLIKSYGFVPGIWLSPIWIAKNTKTFCVEEHCLRRRDTGELYENFGFVIPDITNPRVSEIIISCIKNLENDGFGIFKLDFLHHIATVDEQLDFYHNEIPRIEIIREFLSKLRDTLKKDTVIITCGCSPAACAGISNINRIGGDIATFTNTVKILSQFLAVRYWMNGILFQSDPDFLVVRTKETSHEENNNPFLNEVLGNNPADAAGSRSGNQWETAGEARIWASLVGMSGGTINLGDRLLKLNSEGRNIIKKTIENVSVKAAIPVDLESNHYPEIWYRDHDGEKYLLFINWDDKIKIIEKSDIFKLTACNKVKKDVWENAGIRADGSFEVLKIGPFDAIWIQVE